MRWRGRGRRDWPWSLRWPRAGRLLQCHVLAQSLQDSHRRSLCTNIHTPVLHTSHPSHSIQLSSQVSTSPLTNQSDPYYRAPSTNFSCSSTRPGLVLNQLIICITLVWFQSQLEICLRIRNKILVTRRLYVRGSKECINQVPVVNAKWNCL